MLVLELVFEQEQGKVPVIRRTMHFGRNKKRVAYDLKHGDAPGERMYIGDESELLRISAGLTGRAAVVKRERDGDLLMGTLGLMLAYDDQIPGPPRDR